jgi:DNA uptake protein ComE-like DNA-binding protein
LERRTESKVRFLIGSPTLAETVVLLAAAAMAVLLCLPFRRPVPDLSSFRRETFVHRVDIRTARPAELTLLPGIGPYRARRIVEAREGGSGEEPVENILIGAGVSRANRENLEPWIRSDRE